ncbi:glycosyltransferase [Litorimonas sp. WD9-15]|uniref:glycosyltransferase n=1 Tax=Litorimonas sp. WD9-15 TaxID=3418716 RepID=UPI003D03683E
MTDAEISVVIPTYEDDPALANLLLSLSFLDVAEIIVSDGVVREPPQNTLSNSGSIPLTYIPASRGRGSQIAAGIDQANQNTIWVLHTDSVPHTQSVAEIRRLLANQNITLGCFPLRFKDRSFWLKLFSVFSRFESALTTFGDQGYFFRLRNYKALDLNLCTYPLLEDVALRSALKAKGKVRKSSLALTTSARRFKKYGYLRTQVRNLNILLRYKLGEHPAQLYRRYYGTIPQTAPTHPPSSTAHPV